MTNQSITRMYDEARKEVMAVDTGLWSSIKGRETVKQAIIVAAVQGHGVGLCGPHNADPETLLLAANQLGVPGEVVKWPQGEKPDSEEKRRLFKKKYGPKLHGMFAKTDIHVACPVPTQSELRRLADGTSLDDARERVGRVERSPQDVSRVLDDPATALLRHAVRRCEWGQRQSERVMDIAVSIALLDGSDKVEAPHVAAAIQYRMDRPNLI